VVCLLDGDQAGQKAALSYVPIFLKTGLDARFATLPEGSDPDQILVNHGKEALKKIIEAGQPMISYVCGKILSKSPTPHEKIKVTDFFFPTFTEMESLVVRDSYLNDLADVLIVPAQALKADFQKFNRNRKPAYQQKTTNNSTQKVENKTTERLTTAEDDLLYCLLHDVRLGSSLSQIIDPSWLDTKVTAGRILAKILAEILADGPLESSEMEELLEADSERFVFQNLLFQESEEESDTAIMDTANHCIAALFAKNSRKSEKILLSKLQELNHNSSSNTELRAQLKEIRSCRKNPPKILETELDPKL
jgi:DNA primase